MIRSAPVLFLIIVVGGCADRYSVADYRRDLATLHCARMTECCTSIEYTDWWTGSFGTQDCQEVWEHRDGLAQDDALDAGNLDFDPVAAHACLDALRVQACGEFEPAYRYRETYCEAALHGLVGDGEACKDDVECASTHCVLDAVTQAQVCVPGARTGEPCSRATPCDRPDECQADGLCGLGLPAGAVCETDADCIDHWCLGSGVFTRGTCVRACDGR